MRARTLFLDRLIALVLALLLIAVGIAGWAWYYSYALTAGSIDVRPLRRVLATDWWPWALAAAALLLSLAGLQRLLAHVPRGRVSSLRLPSSGDDGGLAVDSAAIIDATVAEIEREDGVRSCRGRVVRDRRRLVVHLTVVTFPNASLSAVTRACDWAATTITEMTGREDLGFRSELRVGRGRRMRAPIR